MKQPKDKAKSIDEVVVILRVKNNKQFLKDYTRVSEVLGNLFPFQKISLFITLRKNKIESVIRFVDSLNQWSELRKQSLNYCYRKTNLEDMKSISI